MSDTERDYRDTLNLPQTDFPMKAGLPALEKKLLGYWREMNLYGELRKASKGREKFVLHDGPPYANGDIHIGHALNKILKDVIVRSRQMSGKDAPYVPGWDCHGLPIEWQIEEQYRADGRNKDESLKKFRADCRDSAEKWIKKQSKQFQQLGVLGDWDNYYSTMSREAEAAIVEEFHKFVMDDLLYRDEKPVMWSVVEKTALAEAEVEYKEIESKTIFVKFPASTVNTADFSNNEPLIAPEHTFFVIWTTTPWTIPGNRAIAFSPQLSYGLYQTERGKLILCDALAERVFDTANIENYRRLEDIDMNAMHAYHPLYKKEGYYFKVPVLPAGFITAETGTGLVHIAPGHGQDDFRLANEVNNATADNTEIEIPRTVDENGFYYDEVALFGGKRVLDDTGEYGDANDAVITELNKVGALLARGTLRHQYPHSWRSKTPLIFRNTPQWFISMDKNGLRGKALYAIKKVNFLPKSGKNRIFSMVETRPDWVVSRQRAWGVPLMIFTCRKSGEILRDEEVNSRIVEAVRKCGAEAWFDTDCQEFLGDKYKAEDYEQVPDILDVWFDSGVTHSFVLDEDTWPADVYLEGSDQHRGWFQSSLLTACATRGKAPYKNVITHGFTMDEKGRKMSKSQGNAIDPLKVAEQSGAEIIRLWTASCDYSEDQHIGPNIIQANTDAYRKMRNCFRFLLGNLAGFDAETARLELHEMDELERYMLHLLSQTDKEVREGYEKFDFRRVYRAVFHFMTLDLSAFYFDIRKDALYCDPPTSTARRGCRQVMDVCFDCLTAWLAPILCFTTEEVWQSRFGTRCGSVHERQFYDIPPDWHNPALAAKWEVVRKMRRVVTGALEVERRDKRIGSSLEAAPTLFVANAEWIKCLDGLDMAEICITSQLTLSQDPPPADAWTLDDVPQVGVLPHKAKGKKCRRSWKILPEVGSVAAYPDLTPRDAEAVAEYDARH